MPNFLAIDFETANPSSDSACSIGLVKVEKSKIIRKEVHLIKPPSSFFTFSYIHGITWKEVRTARHFGELWPEIQPFFKDVDFVAAHNVSFDKRVLKACCERYEVDFPALPFICTVQLARQAWDLYPTKLPDVCRYLQLHLDHHNALSDAEACANIVLAVQEQLDFSL